MSHEYGSQLFNTSGAMCAAIVSDYLFAGGNNDSRDVAEFLANATDEQLTKDCIRDFGLDQEVENRFEIEGDVPETWLENRDSSVSELLGAFNEFRAKFERESDPVFFARKLVDAWCDDNNREATVEDGLDYVETYYGEAREALEPCPVDLAAVLAAAKPMIVEALAIGEQDAA